MGRRGIPARHTGFTIIELLLVVTLIGIVSAIAVPLLGRAKGAAYEASTIGSLRAINSAEALFASTCGGGYFAPTIPSLATKPPGSKAPFIDPGFTANTFVRQNYTIRFTAGAVAAASPATCNGLAKGKAVSTYFVAADLVLTTTGMSRYFGVNASGVIFQSTKRVPVTQSGVPPAPAKPIG
jgi:prepilin-type N-terminal cleavage/methylation domain-containing protein